MTYKGFKIFDCDYHIVEPVDLWQRYLPDTFKPIAPVGLDEYTVDVRIRVGEKIRPKNALIRPPADKDEAFYTKRQKKYGDAAARGWDADVVLDAMGVEGVDCGVLFPSRALWVIADDTMDQNFARACAAAYNDWLYDFTRKDPKRLMCCGLLSPNDVRDAIDEARRCAEHGFKAVFLRPNPVRGRNWHDPYYDPLWDALEDLNLTLTFHEAYGPDMPQVGDRFGTDSQLVHSVCHPMEQMLCMASIIGGGVLERHPKLRVGFMEGNCGWVAALLFRLEEHYEENAGFSKGLNSLSKEPADYFRDHCFVSVECDETFVGHVVDFLGADNILFSNDWPHIDSKYPNASESFMKLPLDDDARCKILWENTCRMYDLPLDYADDISVT
ncbi:MAG: hypothetical protein CL700_11385 [Chloroflexi bacterium]|nr:hypothetical protein [Chloroflexota bacterium]